MDKNIDLAKQLLKESDEILRIAVASIKTAKIKSNKWRIISLISFSNLKLVEKISYF